MDRNPSRPKLDWSRRPDVSAGRRPAPDKAAKPIKG